MAKISFGDELELFHILRPGIRVRGKVCQSHPLNSMVEIVGEGRLKLSEVVMDIYQVMRRDCVPSLLISLYLLYIYRTRNFALKMVLLSLYLLLKFFHYMKRLLYSLKG